MLVYLLMYEKIVCMCDSYNEVSSWKIHGYIFKHNDDNIWKQGRKKLQKKKRNQR